MIDISEISANTEDKNETDRVIERVVQDLRGQGRKPYLIPVGGSTAWIPRPWVEKR